MEYLVLRKFNGIGHIHEKDLDNSGSGNVCGEDEEKPGQESPV